MRKLKLKEADLLVQSLTAREWHGWASKQVLSDSKAH